MFDAHLMEMLWEGVLDTLYMTVVSTVLSYVFGMVMGVLLVICRKDGIASRPVFYGVLDVVVLENYTNQKQTQYEVELDAHSIAVCIVGGEDADIARTIFERKSGGCGTNGETEVTHVDTEHYNAKYVYRIIRPTTDDFHVQVTFFEEDMNEETKTAVQNAVVSDFLGELTNPRVKLATTVYASRFYRCIQAVTDSPIKEILIGVGDDPLGTSVDIPANVSPALTASQVELVFGG